MALIKDDTKVRLDIPHEPGEWIEFRPARNSDLQAIDFASDPFRGTMKLFDTLISAWSYSEPPSPENIQLLDVQTTNWLGERLRESSGLRTEPEKNGSAPSS